MRFSYGSSSRAPSPTVGIAPPQIAFCGTVLLMALLRLIDLGAALREMNWPVIVMLAAMLPVGQALQTTGTAEILAQGDMLRSAHLPRLC